MTLHSYYLTADYHRTQNLLIAERQKSSQMQAYVDQMEEEVHQQTLLINDLLARNKELDDKLKDQVGQPTPLGYSVLMLAIEGRIRTTKVGKSCTVGRDAKDKQEGVGVER